MGDLFRKTCDTKAKNLIIRLIFILLFYGQDYRTFAEIFGPVSQDTRKPRIISRPGGRTCDLRGNIQGTLGELTGDIRGDGQVKSGGTHR